MGSQPSHRDGIAHEQYRQRGEKEPTWIGTLARQLAEVVASPGLPVGQTNRNEPEAGPRDQKYQ